MLQHLSQRAGAASRAFTSTAMAPATRNERTIRVIQLEPKTKGWVTALD